jgi:tRNA (adenine57-N1/adenine58-N1)-methyltransferase
VKLLIDKRGKKYLLREDVEEFHTSLGVVKLRDAKPGDKLRSHLGHEFYLLEPTVVDYYDKLPRAGSIVLKKEIGPIIAYTGIGSGSHVVEAGTGTGALAIYLAHVVGSEGKVYTYEIREDHLEIARKNFAKAGVEDRIEAKLADVRQGIEERDVDVVVFDMPDPWLAIPHAYEALRHGGFIAVYNPYIEQIRKAYLAMQEANFKDKRVIEILEREIEVKKVGTRPKTRMLGHTGYLAFGRKY